MARGAFHSAPSRWRRVNSAATHRDLQQRIETGQFREDLFYRLSVFPIEITSLSVRPGDIPPLVDEFIRRMNVEQSMSIQFSDDAMAALQSYSWSGNVRELANLIERLVVIKPGGVIDRQDLPWPIVERDKLPAETPEIISHSLTPAGAGVMATLSNDGIDLKQHLADIEKGLIRQALVDSNGVVQGAADLLGVGRTTLVEKVKRYDIDISKS